MNPTCATCRYWFAGQHIGACANPQSIAYRHLTDEHNTCPKHEEKPA